MVVLCIMSIKHKVMVGPFDQLLVGSSDIAEAYLKFFNKTCIPLPIFLNYKLRPS